MLNVGADFYAPAGRCLFVINNSGTSPFADNILK
jgi:hypothetical protein